MWSVVTSGTEVVCASAKVIMLEWSGPIGWGEGAVVTVIVMSTGGVRRRSAL